MPRSRGNWRWFACVFRAGRGLTGDRPPRDGSGGMLIPSVGQERLLLTRSGAGAPELQSLGHVNARGGQAPALRFARPSPFHRSARACPSPCLDREGIGVRFSRGSCASGGQAPALRLVRRHAPPLCRARVPALDPFGSRRSRTTVSGARERSRGTGPRATVGEAVSVSP